MFSLSALYARFALYMSNVFVLGSIEDLLFLCFPFLFLALFGFTLPSFFFNDLESAVRMRIGNTG